VRTPCGGVAEAAAALEHVGERVPALVHRERLALSGRHRNVEVGRIGRDAVDRPLLPPEAAAHHAHARAVVVHDLGNVLRAHVLVARRRHLERRRQIRPQLEAVHPPPGIALRHLLVEDPAARGHPLDVAGPELPRVPEAVAVEDRPREHVRDGLDSAMRVPREAGDVVGRPLVAEIVEQQKRIGLVRLPEAERAAQLDARALEGRNGLDDSLHGTDGHGMTSSIGSAIGRRSRSGCACRPGGPRDGCR
jgi:hypothetical protein